MKEFDVYLFSATNPIKVRADMHEDIGEFVYFTNYNDTILTPPRAKFRLTSVFGIVVVSDPTGDEFGRYFFYDKGYGVYVSENYATNEERIEAITKTINEEGLDSGDDFFIMDTINGIPQVVRIEINEYETIDEKGEDNE